MSEHDSIESSAGDPVEDIEVPSAGDFQPLAGPTQPPKAFDAAADASAAERVDVPGFLPFPGAGKGEREPRLPAFHSDWRSPRIPHLGHLCFLGVLALFGLLAAILLTRSAVYFRLFGVSTLKQAGTDIHYTLGSMAAIYLLTLGACVLLFPLIWHQGFFAGIEWRGATALRLRYRLFGAALVCFLLAMIDQFLLPGPAEAPIDKLFQTPSAAWLLFAFGVTFAPFFEEMAYRGFLLPALATAADWLTEQTSGQPPRPLKADGHPQWSVHAMVIASVFTSIPFALMHADQTAHAAGPFVLLICVSLILCLVRLATRSLAACVVVHASYNFLLFSLMLVSTDGFRHLDKM
jgi:hypothetical protein